MLSHWTEVESFESIKRFLNRNELHIIILGSLESPQGILWIPAMLFYDAETKSFAAYKAFYFFFSAFTSEKDKNS